jgi:hypothetical protein
VSIIRGESVFLSFLYVKLLTLGVEVTFYNICVVTHNKVNLSLLKYPRQTSCCERTDDAFVLFICFCFLGKACAGYA